MDDSATYVKKLISYKVLVLLSRDISGTRKFDDVLNTISREGLLLLNCKVIRFFPLR